MNFTKGFVMRYLLCLSAAALALSACNETAPPGAAANGAADPEPAAGLAEAFGAACSWERTAAHGIAVWGYACADDRLAADDALPGLRREVFSGGEPAFTAPVVQVFTKPADADISAILPALEAAWPGAGACAFAPLGADQYELVPIGERLEAYQAFLSGDADDPALPCGPFGPKEAGQTVFQLFENRPDLAAALFLPSSLAPFDLNTITAH